MDKARFIARLQRFQRSIRRRLIAYGLLAVPAGGVVASLTIIALDWLLTLPAALRIIVTLFFFAGFVLAAFRWVVQPMRARLDLPEIAAKVESYFPQLDERLSCAVSFLRSSDAGSPAMIRHMVQDTEQKVAELSLESTLSLQPLVVRGGLLTLGIVSLTLIGLLAPSWLRTGVHRYLAPFGPVEWPRTVSIVPLTADLTVAVGESATLGMRIERGWTENLRGLVRLREPDGSVLTRTLQREPDGIFRTTIDSVTTNIEYWFEAGDDSTVRRSSTIRVVRRPAVVEAVASVDPPSYAWRRAARVHDLNEGTVRAPLGGQVTVTVRASKPMAGAANDASPSAGLALESGGWIPLQVSRSDSQELTTRFEVTGDLDFRVELIDEFGFTNYGGARYSVSAVPDSSPSVTVLEPRADCEITATGSVDLSFRAEDDFGIQDLRLITARQADGGAQARSLAQELDRVPQEDRAEVQVRHAWNAGDMALSTGDVLVLTIEATDNHPDEAGGQIGRSAPVRVRIISDVEFEVRLRDDLARLEERIRRASLDQSELLDRTTGLIHTEDSDAALNELEREAAAAAAGRQGRLVRRVAETARRLVDLAEQSRRNRSRDDGMFEKIAALGNVLDQVAGGPMAHAGTELSLAAGSSADSEKTNPQTALREAAREQETAVNRMRALMEIMSQWGTFQGLSTKTRDLLDRQTAIQTQTALIGQSTLGKTLESLSAEEAAGLKREHRRQEQLAADVEQHLARLNELAASASPQDPTDRESMEAALRAARSQELTKHLQGAADAIQDNRTSAANLEQRAAAEALRAMAEALGRRERRELENLRKDLERTTEQLAELIRDQEALRTSTVQGPRGDDSVWSGWRQEQRRLRNNTRLFADDLAENRRMAPAAPPLREAVKPMTTAEDQLRQQKGEPAAKAQGDAIVLLRDALVRLQEIDALAAEEEFLRSLGEIRDELETMLQAQTGINEGLVRLNAAAAIAGRLSRAEAREASKLAQQQQENRGRIEALRPALSKVAVYDWALERVGRWMEEIRNRLDDRRLDAALVASGSRIVRELEQLIQALAETQKFPQKREFAESESESGGEGEGASMQGKSVPPVAELLVLKAIQLDINERTRAFAGSVRLDQATESELRELAVLGEDQKEVRRLTERVIHGPNGAAEDSNE